MTTQSYEYPAHSSYAHMGYLDGIYGRDPNPRLEFATDYETGWLHGVEDQGNEEMLAILAPVELKRGDTVVVPKGTPLQATGGKSRKAGKTYTVKLHDVYPLNHAHYGFEGKFVRPKPATVLWAGTGGYWTSTEVRNVQKAS